MSQVGIKDQQIKEIHILLSNYSQTKIMISTFSLTTFFAVLFFSFSDGSTITTSNIIQETCKRSADSTPNLSYNFCVASLESDDRSRCADLHKLGLIAMDLMRHNITSTRRDIRKLLRNKKLDQFVKARLDDCLELYSDAVPILKEAKRCYKEKKYVDANVKVSSVMEAPSTCEDGFRDKEGLVSPLTEKNKNVFRLAALTLSIINMNTHLQ
ncbi:putative invertase inhibitor [Momordica charantia]|uniref:Invertase inhibitor n=1 Tax=Momordica charantia TaxID=3673 RepID=A0A6J1C4E5_MOMCH|nr:putative invertase inhibitor [Momordica charantia]